MRADWKAIRVVYRRWGHKAAREWTETPLMDTLQLSRSLPEETKYGFPTPGQMQYVPLWPVIVRIGRVASDTPMSCLVDTRPVGELHYVCESLASTLLVTPDAAVRLKTLEPDTPCWVFRIVAELDEHQLNIMHRHALPPLPSIVYEPTTGSLLHLAAELEAYRQSFGRRADEVDVGKIVACLTSCVLEVFDAIDAASKHFVEVTRIPNPGKPQKPRHDKKPWTRDDLHEVILIDLAEAKKYGHRVDRGGSHASPIPHTRRGHYATLRADRFGANRGKRVWRKPAWIGDTEWIFEGRQYRVISPPGPHMPPA